MSRGLALVSGLAVVAAFGAMARARGDEARRVDAGEWCVTRGKLSAGSDGRARIEEPKVRAVVPKTDGNDVEIRFDYDGPSVETARLGSGELRRQIGLKLRAADGCNLVYVMWRIEPRAELVVSIKRNPGKRTHRECGTAGYQNLKPSKGGAAAAMGAAMAMAPGSHHALHAVLSGRMLRVWADKALAWEGEVDADALEGPVGMRTDNVRVTVELLARRGGQGAAACGAGGARGAAAEAAEED
ncbi:MAG: hypothetical protein JWN44_6601 [Myxococcales bacterium]|nr:hypothetical protein [Myxococcales bacterium]